MCRHHSSRDTGAGGGSLCGACAGATHTVATDPANPYGAALPWPKSSGHDGPRPQRAAGARVILARGYLIGYLARNGQHLLTFLDQHEDQAQRAESQQSLITALVREAERDPLLIAKINGTSAERSPLATDLRHAGFIAMSRGLLHRGDERGPGPRRRFEENSARRE